MRLLFLVVFLIAVGQAHGQRCVENVQEIGAVWVDQKPKKYRPALNACYTRPGLIPLKRFDKLTEEEKAICGDQLVPFSVSEEPPPIGSNPQPLAVDLKTGLTENVNKSFKFACILCQHYPVVFPDTSFTFPGYTASGRFQVRLTQVNPNGEVTVKPNGQATVKRKLKKQLFEELKERLKPSAPSGINFFTSWLDDDQRLIIEYRVTRSISTSVAVGDVKTTVLNGTFWMQVEDVSFCPEEDTVGGDDVVTHWPRTDLDKNRDAVKFVTDATTGAITGRQCIFDNYDFHGAWTPTLSRWELAWVPCSGDTQYQNEWDYMQFLNASAIKLRHTQFLQPFTMGPVDVDTLTEVAGLVDREFIIQKDLSEPIMRDLAAITAQFAMQEEFFAVAKPHVSLAVADLRSSEPFVGFSLEFQDKEIDRIAAKSEMGLGDAPFAFDVSSSLVQDHSRVAFVISRKNPEGLESLIGMADYRFIEVTMMFPTKEDVSSRTLESYANHHVDILFESSLIPLIPNGDGNDRLSCVAWDYSARVWTDVGCSMLQGDREGYSDCRCNGKFFVLQDEVPTARFGLKQVRKTAAAAFPAVFQK